MALDPGADRQQTEALLDALEQRLAARLRPVDEQADWIAEALNNGRIDLARPGELDSFMFGALGVTPQVSDIGIVDAAGRAQRWRRGELRALRDDCLRAPRYANGLSRDRWSRTRVAAASWKPAERVPSLLHQMPLHRAGQFVGMLGAGGADREGLRGSRRVPRRIRSHAVHAR